MCYEKPSINCCEKRIKGPKISEVDSVCHITDNNFLLHHRPIDEYQLF